MNRFAKAGNTHWHVALAVSMALVSSSCVATSRLGNAKISDLNGLPCFSVPLDAETRDGVPLYIIAVTEIKSSDGGKTLPSELWHFTAANLASPPMMHPSNCIRYGQAPSSTVQRVLKPLQQFHPYLVSIVARKENSNMLAYSAEFCLKPNNSGKIAVQVISHDRSEGDQRYNVCTRPQ